MHVHVGVQDVGTGRYIVIHEIHVKWIYGIFHVYLYSACSVYRSCEKAVAKRHVKFDGEKAVASK